MSPRGEGVACLRWRKGSTTNMHYYEDNKFGYGYVQRMADGQHYASAYAVSAYAATLKSAKTIVEDACRAVAEKRPMSKRPCRPWCGKPCPEMGIDPDCFHTPEQPLRFCRAKCRDAWEVGRTKPYAHFASSPKPAASKPATPKPAVLKTVTVEVLTCNHCGRYAVSLDGHRVTAHKCRGQWTVVHTEKTTDIRPSWKRP